MEKETYKRLMNIFTKYYDTLPEEEQELLAMVLQAYKSSLFLVINGLKEILTTNDITDPNTIIRLFTEDKNRYDTIMKFRKVWLKYQKGELPQPEYKFLKLLNMNTEKEFVDSLINICNILESYMKNIVTDIDIELYRGFNAPKGTTTLSKSEYISTSTSKNIAFNFTHHDEYYYEYEEETDELHKFQLDGYLAHIKLEAGSNFIIFPSTPEDDQYEVLLLSSSLDIKLISENNHSQKYDQFWKNNINQEYICTPKQKVSYPKK